MSTLASIVSLKAASEHADALHRMLVDLAVASRAEPGCLTYDLYRGEDGNWIIVESWRDAAAFDAHLAMPHTRKALESFGTMLAGPPRIDPCVPESVARAK